MHKSNIVHRSKFEYVHFAHANWVLSSMMKKNAFSPCLCSSKIVKTLIQIVSLCMFRTSDSGQTQHTCTKNWSNKRFNYANSMPAVRYRWCCRGVIYLPHKLLVFIAQALQA